MNRRLTSAMILSLLLMTACGDKDNNTANSAGSFAMSATNAESSMNDRPSNEPAQVDDNAGSALTADVTQTPAAKEPGETVQESHMEVEPESDGQAAPVADSEGDPKGQQDVEPSDEKTASPSQDKSGSAASKNHSAGTKESVKGSSDAASEEPSKKKAESSSGKQMNQASPAVAAVNTPNDNSSNKSGSSSGESNNAGNNSATANGTGGSSNNSGSSSGSGNKGSNSSTGNGSNAVKEEAPVQTTKKSKNEITWEEFFDNELQNTPSKKFWDLDGKKVKIKGYMGEVLSFQNNWFLLIPAPGAECPFDNGDESYWNKIMIVFVPSDASLRYTEGPLMVTGELDVGIKIDESNYKTMFRLYDAKFEQIKE